MATWITNYFCTALCCFDIYIYLFIYFILFSQDKKPSEIKKLFFKGLLTKRQQEIQHKKMTQVAEKMPS